MTARLASPMPFTDAAARGNAILQARYEERRTQYRALREDGATINAAAEKVGIKRRTALLYERAVCAGLPRDPSRAECHREGYAELRAQGLTVAQAAARLRVTRRTAHRYEAALRQAGADQ